MELAVIHSAPLIVQRDQYDPPSFDWVCFRMTSCSWWLSLTFPWKKASPWMKKMKPRSDRCLPAVLFLLFSPSSLHPNGKFTPSSIIPFSLSLPFHFLFVSFSFLFSCVPFHYAICTSVRSFWVTAVHSPVPYCGAVHHLHAFSILQQNEFLIGPERGGRSGNRRWLF